MPVNRMTSATALQERQRTNLKVFMDPPWGLLKPGAPHGEGFARLLLTDSTGNCPFLRPPSGTRFGNSRRCSSADVGEVILYPYQRIPRTERLTGRARIARRHLFDAEAGRRDLRPEGVDGRRGPGTREARPPRLPGAPLPRGFATPGRAAGAHSPADGSRQRGLSPPPRRPGRRLAEPDSLLRAGRTNDAAHPRRPRPGAPRGETRRRRLPAPFRGALRPLPDVGPRSPRPRRRPGRP